MRGDPVFRDDAGQWWFYDEVWENRHGPYPNEHHARGMLRWYCDRLDAPKREPVTSLEMCIMWGAAVLLCALTWIVAVAAYRYFTA